jgi:hypothetical protein
MMGMVFYLGAFVYHLFIGGAIAFLLVAIIRFFYPKVHAGWLVLISVGIGYWYVFGYFDLDFEFDEPFIYFILVLNIVYMPIVAFSAMMLVRFLKYVKRRGDALG